MHFRYDTAGLWLKGNTHIHSVASDGGKAFEELAAIYAAANYDFLFRTDHWVCSNTSQDNTTYPLLWLDGIELDGTDHAGGYFHVVCLGAVSDVSRADGFDLALENARAQGALTVLAHPYWCGNTLEDCLRWDFDGVEIYNHVCHWLNGKSAGAVHWDAALMQNPSTLGFAVDDAHLKPEHMGYNGGWIVVNVPERTNEAILDAIRKGNFYSSCGPEFKSIRFADGQLHVETSAVQFARLVGPKSRGIRLGNFDSDPLRSLCFSVPEDWQFAYLEIEDIAGRQAWTNSLFIEHVTVTPSDRHGV